MSLRDKPGSTDVIETTHVAPAPHPTTFATSRDNFRFWPLPFGNGWASRRTTMTYSNRSILLVVVSTTVFGWSGISFAYRPFDSTDAAVADVNQLEIELGPAQFRRATDERTVIAPAYVINYGFVKNWEVVLEGRAEHPLAPPKTCKAGSSAMPCS